MMFFIVMNIHLDKSGSEMDVVSGRIGMPQSKHTSALTTVANLMSLASQFSFLIDLLIIFLQARALRKAKYSLAYKFFAHLHNFYHRGKPPFVPIDTRGGTAQTIVLSGVMLVWGFGSRLIMAFIPNTVAADRAVMNLSVLLFLSNYLLTCGVGGKCPLRAFTSVLAVAGKMQSPPQRWNGLEVVKVSYSNTGPSFDYTSSDFMLTEDWGAVAHKYMNKYLFTTPSHLTTVLPQPFAPLFAMLMCWHTSLATWILLAVHIVLGCVFFITLFSVKFYIARIAWRNKKQETSKDPIEQKEVVAEQESVVVDV